MKEEYLQNLRYKLQNRVRNISKAEPINFRSSLQHFVNFINEQPSLLGIFDDLTCLHPNISEDTILEMDFDGGVLFETVTETACFAYRVLKYCVNCEDSEIENWIGHCYVHENHVKDNLDAFYKLFVNPVYEYLDEHLDDQRMMLVIFQRYKQKCEWFQRDYLFQGWEENTRKGEKELACRLYEYLHDQGLDFSIEPSSISGEADLVAAQNTDDPLIADVKIYCPRKSKGKTYIINGFRQVYQYTLDYNESFGYLIIFNTSGQDIKFLLHDQSQKTPFVRHNNKMIFFIVIDIFPYEKSASKRGPLTTVEITEDEIVRRILEPI